MRVKPPDLRRQIDNLANRGFDVAIGWAYGQPRVTTKSESRDISPRLPCREMQIWIEGFRAALDEIERKEQKSARDTLACAFPQ